MACFRSLYHVAIVVWSIAFLAIAGSAVLDAHEALDDFFHQYEAYRLDKLFVALNVSGALGLIYSFSRVRDVLDEVERRNQAEAKVDQAKFHDCLTGLPNRQMPAANMTGPPGYHLMQA